METYRSGHNGADSKSVCGQPHVGSNPTVSATSEQALYRLLRLFYKSQSARMPLLLLSKSQPLRWVVIWFGQILWITASILFGLHTSSRMSYHSRRRFFTSSLIHSIAPPFQIEPTALGFYLVFRTKHRCNSLRRGFVIWTKNDKKSAEII